MVVTAGTLVSASAATGSGSATPQASAPVVRKLGYIPIPEKKAAPALSLVRRAALPSSVDLTPQGVPVGDQGAVGSCASWAVGYTLLGYYSKAQKHAGQPFAPMYLYSQVNRGVDQGSTTRDNYNVLTSQGIAERSVYTQGDYDWRTQPTAAQRANAANHKTTSPIYIFNGQNAGPNATAGIKSALAAGNPVLLAIPVYQGFYGLNALNSTFRLANVSGSNLGGHAITVMGYNSTGAIIQNSWGTGWGGSGFATIGWDFIERYAYEASYLTGFA